LLTTVLICAEAVVHVPSMAPATSPFPAAKAVTLHTVQQRRARHKTTTNFLYIFFIEDCHLSFVCIFGFFHTANGPCGSNAGVDQTLDFQMDRHTLIPKIEKTAGYHINSPAVFSSLFLL